MEQYTEYKDIHEHQGTENYEIIKIYDKQYPVEEILIDKKEKNICLNDDIDEDILNRKKVDYFGNILSAKGINYKVLDDGTLWHPESYRNWIINGNEEKLFYTDPFTNKFIQNIYDFNQSETDYKKWIVKFEELYKNSKCVVIEYEKYYLKIGDNWFFVKANHHKDKNRPKNFVKQYPAKTNSEEIRMVNIPEISDRILGKELKIVKYIEQDKREGRGLNPINFSSGYYMFELHLPQGDVLKFRRYGAVGFSADLNIYQIPEELGGSNEVYFIEQKPREMYPNKSFAGFYCIRPKNYKELPEYKPYLENEKQEELKKRRGFIDNE